MIRRFRVGFISNTKDWLSVDGLPFAYDLALVASSTELALNQPNTLRHESAKARPQVSLVKIKYITNIS